ncbi:MAG TPA: DUF5666 domain-containing protein [Candidatus Sulfotelmatobacter sp.]|nr:DUF5666 domain-containing protein [Candidatus Sulfotelmatobacter sp.]
MQKNKNTAILIFLSCVIGVAGAASHATSRAQDVGQPTIAKRIGAIKAINGNVITLAPDSGAEIAVSVQPNARLLRLGSDKDLKNATPVQLSDLQVGDTIRARGQAAPDGKSIAALEIIVITRSAVQAVSDQMRQDWQKRGVGGPVSAVDPAAGTVTISISSLGGKKTMVVRASKNTAIHRYAPDSAKPEDAKPSTLQDIHVGDQLRARGDRSADGGELAAEEIFSGNFPTVSGLIKSVDASAGTISVQDVVSKKTVQLKITADSQLHQIPAEMAQRFATRLKGSMPPGTPGAAASSSANSAPPAGANAPPGAASGGWSQGSGATGGGGNPGGARPGGGFDFQRLLDQTPAVALADLHKGDAIAVLSTEGTPSGGSTVIKLFSGVEPILQAAPNGSQAMMLAPWSLGGAPGGDAGP